MYYDALSLLQLAGGKFPKGFKNVVRCVQQRNKMKHDPVSPGVNVSAINMMYTEMHSTSVVWPEPAFTSSLSRTNVATIVIVTLKSTDSTAILTNMKTLWGLPSPQTYAISFYLRHIQCIFNPSYFWHSSSKFSSESFDMMNIQNVQVMM